MLLCLLVITPHLVWEDGPSASSLCKESESRSETAEVKGRSDVGDSICTSAQPGMVRLTLLDEDVGQVVQGS